MKFKLLSAVFLLVGLVACHNDQEQKQATTSTVANQPEIKAPDFNADSAFSFVKAQVDFGPRVPNTKAHVACGDYLIAQMKRWSDTVIVQSGVVTAYDGTKLKFRNIISSFNSDKKERVLLFAHWDTRPWSDQDTENKDKPSLAANDGGSGVAVLMEMARQFKLKSPGIGVDIAFFDAEDWGKEGGGPESEDSYALGTQYWAKNLHVKGYTAKYGILLDMVGAKDAQFRYEGLSYQKAGEVVDKVWQNAASLGYGNFFLNQDGGWVTDDHVYVNNIGIPAIDIIHSDPTSHSGFAKHWHTHDDNLNVIDPLTLKAVGQTLLKTVRIENGGN